MMTTPIKIDAKFLLANYRLKALMFLQRIVQKGSLIHRQQQSKVIKSLHIMKHILCTNPRSCPDYAKPVHGPVKFLSLSSIPGFI